MLKSMQRVKEIILQKSSSLKNEVIRLRRHFHMNPELSFNETGTASFIAGYLHENNISFRDGIAGTGIIGRIDGNKKGNMVIAVRAEMDGLPVSETNKTSYTSNKRSVMHACGHDAHMAMLLGAARIMYDMRDQFSGTILLLFQPGEEKSPGGARLMIESGELGKPKPDIIIAQHVLPELETGRTGYKPGRYMASCDEIYITVAGTGGHAALPGLTTDQILITSHLVIRLKEAITKKASGSNIPTVFGIGKISGEGATNIIPDKVEIAGTFRTFDEEWRKESQELIKSVCEKTATEFGVKVILNIAEGYPVLINDEKLTTEAITLSSDLLGKNKVEVYTETRMSSDDFSFYSGLAPSLYFRIGIKKEGTEMKKLHSSDFDIDEESLETGVSNLCWLVLNLLSKDFKE
jgi:amidohydrolase